MILPTKYSNAHESLLGVGATILDNLHSPKTVSTLWYEVQDAENVETFQTFILGLVFLFSIGAIDYRNNFLDRNV